MNRDDIIRMAREAGSIDSEDVIETVFTAFAAAEADRIANESKHIIKRAEARGAAAEREKVARWMIQRSYATGHGDTTEDLLQELEWQILEGWNRALMNGVKTEREECAKHFDGSDYMMYRSEVAAAIRARGNNAP